MRFNAVSGYKTSREAARAAWRVHVPRSSHHLPQGSGGWFRESNGLPVAHGLDALAVVCMRRRWILRGRDGRWYVIHGPYVFGTKSAFGGRVAWPRW